jgi:hypothetical protein
VVHKNHHMSFGRVSDHSLQIRKSQYFWDIQKDMSLSSFPPVNLWKLILTHSVSRERSAAKMNRNTYRMLSDSLI